jgi:prepilin peptidase CpaA
MLHTLSVSLLPALMIAAALTDVTSFRIPNWLLFFVGYALFALGLFGGGDSKLMAAAGLWFGTSQTLPFLLMTAVAGGFLAIAIAGWSVFMVFWQIHGPEAGSRIDQKLKKVRPKLPYGFAFAVGAILAFPDTWWMNVA